MDVVQKLFNEKAVVFFDGAMGTMLQQNGMPRGTRSDIMNAVMPGTVEAIHRQYVDAGSDIICANTFGANRRALFSSSYTPEQIISSGLKLALRAAEGKALVALDIGPVGELLSPSGDITHEDAYDLFKEQAVIGSANGADLAAIETMGDISELRIAIRAVKENTSLPVFATMTFMENIKTYMGASPVELAQLADEYGISAVGINCSYPPEKMLPAARALREMTKIPLIIKLNAGMPESDGSYALTPEAFAEQMLAYRDLDIKVVGACCGSSPEFIRALRKAFS